MSGQERRSELAKLIEQRKRPIHDFPTEKFMGPANRPVGGVKVRLPSKHEEMQARLEADEEIRRRHKEGVDEDHKVDTRTVYLLHRIVRDHHDPDNFPAFPSPAWMLENMTNEEIGCLLRLVAAVKHCETPLEKDLSEELIEAYVTKAADHYGSAVANAVFARCDRTWVEDFAIAVCKKLVELRAASEPQPEPEPASED